MTDETIQRAPASVEAEGSQASSAESKLRRIKAIYDEVGECGEGDDLRDRAFDGMCKIGHILNGSNEA